VVPSLGVHAPTSESNVDSACCGGTAWDNVDVARMGGGSLFQNAF
jgi:hypothetical protein